MELLVTAFPASFHTRLYPLIERLQDRLGAINDHAVALKRFRSWSTETADAALPLEEISADAAEEGTARAPQIHVPVRLLVDPGAQQARPRAIQKTDEQPVNGVGVARLTRRRDRAA